MQSIAKQLLPALTLAVAAAVPAYAAPVIQGSAHIFNSFGSVPVAYNEAIDVLSVPPPASGEIFLPGCSNPSGLCPGGAISGFQSLVMNVDAQGHSAGGTYSFFGIDPQLGITTPRLLLAGAITGVSISDFTSAPSGD